MKIAGNVILITGGGSGIGRGLAEALHAEGNKVIIAGRRRAALEEVAAAHPDIEIEPLDVADAAAIGPFIERVTSRFPTLNVLINNAGIMKVEDLTAAAVDVADAEAIVTTNLLGPIRLTSALLPHLRAQPSATIVMVSSGLAFVPLAETPTYCATKAAIHSYSDSLRHQLRETSVGVLEIAPPAVATDLMPHHAESPYAIPLDAFISETIANLKAEPDAPENLVRHVAMLRTAERNGKYDEVFAMINRAS